MNATLHPSEKGPASPKDARISAKNWDCCAFARSMECRLLWIDSCCINKTSSAEPSEAINSTHACYSRASDCYVVLHEADSDQDPSEWRSNSREVDAYSGLDAAKAHRTNRPVCVQRSPTRRRLQLLSASPGACSEHPRGRLRESRTRRTLFWVFSGLACPPGTEKAGTLSSGCRKRSSGRSWASLSSSGVQSPGRSS